MSTGIPKPPSEITPPFLKEETKEKRDNRPGLSTGELAAGLDRLKKGTTTRVRQRDGTTYEIDIKNPSSRKKNVTKSPLPDYLKTTPPPNPYEVSMEAEKKIIDPMDSFVARGKNMRIELDQKAKLLYEEAVALLEDSKYQRAAELFEKSNDLRESPEALLGQAEAFYSLKMFQKALWSCYKAFKIEPSLKNILLQVKCYRSQKRYGKAVSLLEEAVKVDKTNQDLVEILKTTKGLQSEKSKSGFLYDLECGEDVTSAYERIRKSQPCKEVKSAVGSWDPATHVRFVCISDTHNRHHALELPPGDVLIHAGDFSMTGQHPNVKAFGKWLETLPYKHKIVIAGNHDITLDAPYYNARGAKRFHYRKKYDTKETPSLFTHACTYLNDETVTVEGIKIYGSPWSPTFCDWAFNADRGDQCRTFWEKIPDDIEVLITHGPPLGHGDLCSSGHRAGCMDLLHAIQQRIQPLYHIFGHVHEGYGMTSDGVTTYINASTCTLRYHADNSALIFDVPRDPAKRHETGRKCILS